MAQVQHTPARQTTWCATALNNLRSAACKVWHGARAWLSPPGQPALATRMLVECLTCGMFHWLGSAAPTPVTNGLALAVLVYYSAKVSGGHLNPAATLTFTLLGHVNPVEMVAYWVAQVVGCVLGAFALAAVVPGLTPGTQVEMGSHLLPHSGCFVPRADLDALQIIGWEAAGTFCFLVPVFSVVWYTQTKSGYGNTGPLIAGLSLLTAAHATGVWTGGALNPARALASSLVFGCPREDATRWYVAGELLGAALVPFAILPWYGVAINAWYWPLPCDAISVPDATDSPTSRTATECGDDLSDPIDTGVPELARTAAALLGARLGPHHEAFAASNMPNASSSETSYVCVHGSSLLRRRTQAMEGGGLVAETCATVHKENGINEFVAAAEEGVIVVVDDAPQAGQPGELVPMDQNGASEPEPEPEQLDSDSATLNTDNKV